jgi:hypothetical protein
METINRYFRDLTKAAFARHGFAQLDILGHWAEIVGPALAGTCRPERIRWPRGEGEDRQKRGGTLIVEAAPGRALDIQHETPHMRDRINGFFGYGAIAEIKIKQGRWGETASAPSPAALPADDAATLESRLTGIPDDALRDAVKRLGRAALAQQRTSS